MAGELKNRNEQLKGLQARFEIFYAISKLRIIGWGLCDIQNNQGQTLTSTLIIPDITKTESNNNYCFVLVFFFEENKVTQHYMKHCLKFLLEIMHCHTTYRLVTNLLADN